MGFQRRHGMKRIVLAAAWLLGAFGVQAQSIGGSPFIAVHGKAKTEVIPDIFPVTITLKDTSLDTAATQALIEGDARKIIDRTQSMKMASGDVDVSNLSVSPEYRWDDKERKQVFLGNTYRREIKLRFHKLADLGIFVEALPKAKHVQINTGGFESSKADELRRELVAKAVGDARSTAETMARAVGKRVGPVHNISNQSFNVSYVVFDDPSPMDVAAPAPAPAITLREGTIQLDQNVYIIYTLID